jgi:hypothetical protein
MEIQKRHAGNTTISARKRAVGQLQDPQSAQNIRSRVEAAGLSNRLSDDSYTRGDSPYLPASRLFSSRGAGRDSKVINTLSWPLSQR